MKPEIPTIEPTLVDTFHFKEMPWKWKFFNQHHLFHINRIEDVRNQLSFPLPPHRKTNYDLIFFTKGTSLRSKGLSQYQIEKNQFFFLPAWQITSHESMSEDAEGFYIHFSSELFGDNQHLLKPFPFLSFFAHPVVSIPDTHVSPIMNIFYRLESLYGGRNQQDLNLFIWYLLALFTEVNQFVEDAKVHTPKRSATYITQEYKNALTQHIYDKQSVQDYAEMLHITPNHLNKCVKKTHNKTAHDLLNEMLILEAKSMLKYTKLSISEIAERFNRTPSNFTRFFKRQTDLTPKKYLETD